MLAGKNETETIFFFAYFEKKFGKRLDFGTKENREETFYINIQFYKSIVSCERHLRLCRCLFSFFKFLSKLFAHIVRASAHTQLRRWRKLARILRLLCRPDCGELPLRACHLFGVSIKSRVSSFVLFLFCFVFRFWRTRRERDLCGSSTFPNSRPHAT